MLLLDRLLGLHRSPVPVEDFFTEVLAHVFGADVSLLLDWLRMADVIGETSADATAKVRTQVALASLDGHVSGSRPDMVIDVQDNGLDYVVVVESKIDAPPTGDQLARYADHLAKWHRENASLLYVTRDFPGEIPEQEWICTRGVNFKMSRWSEFYRLLERRDNVPLRDEVMRFMETHRMAQSNRFTATDAVSLSGFPTVLSFMEETLSGEIQNEFKRLMRGSSRASASLTQFRDHRRYVIFRTFGSFECLLGYWVDRVDIGEYPRVGLHIGAGPNREDAERLGVIFREIGERPEWSEPYGLGLGEKWMGVYREKSMREFVQHEDHIAAVKQYFSELLSDLEGLIEKYPDLPWKTSEPTEDG